MYTEGALQIYQFAGKFAEDKRKLHAPHLGTIVKDLSPDSLDEAREMSRDKANERK